MAKDEISLTAPSIAQIAEACCVPQPNESAVRRYLLEGGRILLKGLHVAGDADHLVGYCASRVVNGAVWIDTLLIHPHYRGLGYGTELLGKALKPFSDGVQRALAFADPSHPDCSDYIEWLTSPSRKLHQFHSQPDSPRANRIALGLNNSRTEATINRIREQLSAHGHSATRAGFSQHD